MRLQRSMHDRLYPLTADDGTNVSNGNVVNPSYGMDHIILSPGIKGAAWSPRTYIGHASP